MKWTYNTFRNFYLVSVGFILFATFIYIFVLPGPVFITPQDIVRAKQITKEYIYSKPLTPTELKAYNVIAIPIKTKDSSIYVFYFKKDRQTKKLHLVQKEKLN